LSPVTLNSFERHEEAIATGEQALAHSQDDEGPVSWYSNQERLLQAQRWLSLDRYTETSAFLEAVLNSLESKSDAEEDDQALLKNAKELRQSMGERQASEPEPPA
jgi:hypothetical protein